jgi:hypothetical protein
LIAGVGAFLLINAPAFAAVPQIDQSFVITCGNSQGTGFFIDGQVAITARHVVKGCKSVAVTNSAKENGSASVEFVSTNDDVAVIRVSGVSAATHAYLLDTSAVKVKEAVEIVGSPIDGLVLSQGTVAAIKDPYTPRSILLNVPADHGNSGGPVFSSKGVIGEVVELTSMGQVVALNAQVIQTALASYKNQTPKPSSSASLPAVTTKVVVIDQNSPRILISLVINGVMFLVVVALILSRRKRFSRKKIVINLPSSTQPANSDEMENK